MKLLFTLALVGPIVLSPQESAPQEPAPWIDSAPAEWPALLLTNHATFAGSSPLEGASAFLIREGEEVLAVTGRHLLGSAGGVEPEVVVFDLDFALERWLLHARGDRERAVEVEGLWRSGCDYGSRDALLMTLKEVPEELPALPLAVRREAPAIGEPIFLVGQSYGDPQNTQRVFRGEVLEAYEDGTFEFSVDPPFELSGYSGAPVLDSAGRALGLLSYAWSEDPEAEVYELAGGDLLAPLLDMPPRLREVARLEHELMLATVGWSPAGDRLLLAPMDVAAEVWNAELDEQLAVCAVSEEVSMGGMNSLAGAIFSPDGTRLAAWYLMGPLQIYGAGTGELLVEFEGEPSFIAGAAFSPDGSELWTVDDLSSELSRWNAITGELVSTIAGPVALALSPDGAVLATGTDAGEIVLWSTADEQELRRWPAHTGCVSTLAFSADGERLASGGADCAVQVWRAGEGELELALEADAEGEILDLAFTPHGRGLLTASGTDVWIEDQEAKEEYSVPIDCYLRLFRVADGLELARSHDHWGLVNDLELSPDGQRCASVSDDGFLRLWELPEIPK